MNIDIENNENTRRREESTERGPPFVDSDISLPQIDSEAGFLQSQPSISGERQSKHRVVDPIFGHAPEFVPKATTSSEIADILTPAFVEGEEEAEDSATEPTTRRTKRPKPKRTTRKPRPLIKPPTPTSSEYDEPEVTKAPRRKSTIKPLSQEFREELAKANKKFLKSTHSTTDYEETVERKSSRRKKNEERKSRRRSKSDTDSGLVDLFEEIEELKRKKAGRPTTTPGPIDFEDGFEKIEAEEDDYSTAKVREMILGGLAPNKFF